MINDASIEAVQQAQWKPHFIRPLYGSYCFSRIPSLLHSLFSGDEAGIQQQLLGPLAGHYDKVILFFIDAFGWRFFERYADSYPILRRILDEGYATKLTSQFPSTTAAHVTAIHTGLPVDQSGVFEWFYYEPTIDALIAPLLFSFAGDREPGMLLRAGVKPQDIFPYPIETVYSRLADIGVRSSVHQDALYTPSPHGSIAFRGADVVPFHDLDAGLSALSERVLNTPGRSYHFLYIDEIDGAGHHYGPNSPQFDAAVDSTMRRIESFLSGVMKNSGGKTLFLMTADHGQTETDPGTTFYVNLEMPGFDRFIKTNRKGQLMALGGSPRDLFLYIRDEYEDEAQAELTARLEGRAEVHKVRDLIQGHFFGEGEPSARLLDRVSNLVVLPYEGEGMYWYEEGRFSQDFWGHHGGLTRPEMETILLALT
ncbi:MAG TPA: alkaline phosphatase family protein [Chloroflexia bacterium]|nr:alkaline phosphatase family protein [Chloroflexia bacterium]